MKQSDAVTEKKVALYEIFNQIFPAQRRGIDRHLFPDHNKMIDLVESCEIPEEVETAIESME
jgi:hypothetical protein